MAPTHYAAGAPVRQRSLRDHNLALALSLVGAGGAGLPVSRADVAAATGLTRATVSALVDELITGRLVAEVEPAPRTGAGRPAAGLVLDTVAGPVGIGLDIHVDYLAVGAVDLSGALTHHVVAASDGRHRPARDVVAAGARLVEDAAAAVTAAGREVGGLTVAVPGFVDLGGTVRLAPNMGWRDVDVRAAMPHLDAAPHLDVQVDNEANLAALAELRAGTGSPPANFVYVSGEVGVGAGIVLDGRLYRGRHGWAGELGHVTVDPTGPVCRCGSRGCLEQVAGQDAIVRAAGGAADSTGETVARVVELASRGDPTALAALGRAGSALGVALAGAVNLLDIDAVVLGGSYHHFAPWLLEPVEAELRARVVTAHWSPVTLRRSRYGSTAAVVGAAGAVVRAIQERPADWLASRPIG